MEHLAFITLGIFFVSLCVMLGIVCWEIWRDLKRRKDGKE